MQRAAYRRVSMHISRVLLHNLVVAALFTLSISSQSTDSTQSASLIDTSTLALDTSTLITQMDMSASTVLPVNTEISSTEIATSSQTPLSAIFTTQLDLTTTLIPSAATDISLTVIATSTNDVMSSQVPFTSTFPNVPTTSDILSAATNIATVQETLNSASTIDASQTTSEMFAVSSSDASGSSETSSINSHSTSAPSIAYSSLDIASSIIDNGAASSSIGSTTVNLISPASTYDPIGPVSSETTTSILPAETSGSATFTTDHVSSVTVTSSLTLEITYGLEPTPLPSDSLTMTSYPSQLTSLTPETTAAIQSSITLTNFLVQISSVSLPAITGPFTSSTSNNAVQQTSSSLNIVTVPTFAIIGAQATPITSNIATGESTFSVMNFGSTDVITVADSNTASATLDQSSTISPSDGTSSTDAALSTTETISVTSMTNTDVVVMATTATATPVVTPIFDFVFAASGDAAFNAHQPEDILKTSHFESASLVDLKFIYRVIDMPSNSSVLLMYSIGQNAQSPQQNVTIGDISLDITGTYTNSALSINNNIVMTVSLANVSNAFSFGEVHFGLDPYAGVVYISNYLGIPPDSLFTPTISLLGNTVIYTFDVGGQFVRVLSVDYDVATINMTVANINLSIVTDATTNASCLGVALSSSPNADTVIANACIPITAESVNGSTVIGLQASGYVASSKTKTQLLNSSLNIPGRILLQNTGTISLGAVTVFNSPEVPAASVNINTSLASLQVYALLTPIQSTTTTTTTAAVSTPTTDTGILGLYFNLIIVLSISTGVLLVGGSAAAIYFFYRQRRHKQDRNRVGDFDDRVWDASTKRQLRHARHHGAHRHHHHHHQHHDHEHRGGRKNRGEVPPGYE